LQHRELIEIGQKNTRLRAAFSNHIIDAILPLRQARQALLAGNPTA
jgi:hypothetical protein